MTKSMLEYLAGLRRYGHTPEYIGEVTIGRTVYAAGRFVSPEREAPAGSRAALEGRSIPAETRIALMPMYRTDWVTRDSVGPTPNLLPASYVRDNNTLYVLDGQEWYIGGWSGDKTTLWLHQVGDLDNYPPMKTYHRMQTSVHWSEPFETSMRLASPEVLARIASEA
jgi:hypothetical protein